jgi:hypothetical protein
VPAVLDTGSTHARPTAAQAAHVDIVRRTSLGMTVALLVQFAIGMWVNLYITVPSRDHGGGDLAAIGHALSGGPTALAIHTGLGLVILVGTISLVVRSALSRRRSLVVLSAVALIAILGAVSSGAAFVDKASNGASLGMALMTGVALFCLALTLYLTGRPGTAPPAVAGTAGRGSTGPDPA